MGRGQQLAIDVEGPITLDDMELMTEAAADGLGIAFVSSGFAARALAAGEVQLVLVDWTPTFPGYYLYYPGDRLVPFHLRAFIDVLKQVMPYRAGASL